MDVDTSIVGEQHRKRGVRAVRAQPVLVADSLKARVFVNGTTATLLMFDTRAEMNVITLKLA